MVTSASSPTWRGVLARLWGGVPFLGSVLRGLLPCGSFPGALPLHHPLQSGALSIDFFFVQSLAFALANGLISTDRVSANRLITTCELFSS